MHELAIARALVELAGEHARRAGAGSISRLTCRVGPLRMIETDALCAAFEIARSGTACACAELVIETSPLTLRCPECGATFGAATWQASCPRCSTAGQLVSGGDELELCSIEAEAGP